jgi:hypothetical protein
MTGALRTPWLFSETIQVQTLAKGIVDNARGEFHACSGLHDRGLRDGVIYIGLGTSAEAAVDRATLRIGA